MSSLARWLAASGALLAVACRGGDVPDNTCLSDGGACQAAKASGAQIAIGGPGSVLLQVGHKTTRGEEAPALRFGDSVYLRVPRTGRLLAAQEDGKVHAKWANRGSWERFAVESAADGGTGASNGLEVECGAAVYLRAWTGKILSVQEDGVVHAQWGNRGSWERITMNNGGPKGGIFRSGDTVFLGAWTGKVIDADAPISEGVVQARWSNRGEWEQLVLEVITNASVVSVTAQSSSSTEAAAGSSSTAASSTTSPGSSGSCVPAGTLQKCDKCLSGEQCGGGRFCCPYMKKCVISSTEGCSHPIAQCVPMCHDSQDVATCQCENADFPASWQLPTCGAQSAQATTAAAPTSATTSTAAPTSTAATASTAASSAAGTTATDSSTSSGSGIRSVSDGAWAHFQLLNELRELGHTCPGGESFDPNPTPLLFDCRLWAASRLHSEDMATNAYFDHTSLDGRTPWQRAEEQGIRANGENIAAGRSSAQGTLDQWKASNGHCVNMMNPSHLIGAVALAEGGPYRHYWTQMFAHSSHADTSCWVAGSGGAGLVQAHSFASVAYSSAPDDGEGVVPGEPWVRPAP